MYTAKQENNYFELTNLFIKKELVSKDIEQLRELIIYHEWKYYINDNPIISDYDYDVLFQKLKDIETNHPDLITKDSPTMRVSSDLTEDFPTVTHYSPMLSLENSYNEDDLMDFDKQIRKLAEIDEETLIQYSVEPKYDGSTMTLVYENDYLVRGATRGNGIEGDDITPNAKVIYTIPLKANFNNKNIIKAELRGEALIRKDRFIKINDEREKEGLAIFANPRNAASGSLRMKDVSEVKKRELSVISYQLAYAIDSEGKDLVSQFKTHTDSIKFLKDSGFKVPENGAKLCNGIKEAIDFCQEMESKREELPYEIDGMVIKVNEFEIQEKCGYTMHHPRWAIAFKFKAQQAVTTLERVEFQVGRFGTITPVAKISPVQIAGVVVRSVSLHNEDFILKKDLRLGDKVIVERAGEVIPYIVKSLPELRTGEEIPVKYPSSCPVNDTTSEALLTKEEKESAWYCDNCVCGKVDLQKLIFHVSKPGMNIDGFGESYVKRFWDLGWVKDMSDFYNLDYVLISQLEGFGSKSAENIRNAVNKAKNNPLWRLLHSLSIKHFGKKASKLIAQRIDNIWELQNWTEEDFTVIHDIGPSVAKTVSEWFKDEKNIEILKRMETFGVNTNQSEDDKPLEVVENATFRDKTILFTGKLFQIKRKDAQDLATQAGAKNISAVSKNLDVLVVGEKAGSKLKKAKELGTVEIYTEDEFLEKIKEAGLI